MKVILVLDVNVQFIYRAAVFKEAPNLQKSWLSIYIVKPLLYGNCEGPRWQSGNTIASHL